MISGFPCWAMACFKVEMTQSASIVLDRDQLFDTQDRETLKDIIDDRHAKKSTIISSQIPVSTWYEVIGVEGTIADAILDRIVNSSHRIDLNYYYYYHCTSACGVRFKAETANEAFLKQLRYMSPKEAMVDVFIEAFIKDFNNKTKAQNTERANIIG